MANGAGYILQGYIQQYLPSHMWLTMWSCYLLIKRHSLIPHFLNLGRLISALTDSLWGKECCVTPEAKSGKAMQPLHLVFLVCLFWGKQADRLEVQLHWDHHGGEATWMCPGQQPQLSPRAASHVNGTPWKSSPSNLHMTAALANTGLHEWGTPEEYHPAGPFLNSWPRKCEQNKIVGLNH